MDKKKKNFVVPGLPALVHFPINQLIQQLFTERLLMPGRVSGNEDRRTE